jgi:hypothetical protein
MPVDVLIAVLSLLTLPDLMAFRCCSKSTKNIVMVLYYHNVLRILARFFPDPASLLRSLDQNNGIISGSVALYAIITQTQPEWTPMDVDIYVTDFHASKLIEHILSVQHYVFQSEATPTRNKYTELDDVKKVMTFGNGAHNIDIIISDNSCVEGHVFRFHSTPVMNFINGRGVYCAYPLLTLNMRGIIHSQCWKLNKQPKIKMLACVAKYRDRGFDIVRDPKIWPDCAEHTCFRSGTCPHTIRAVNDNRGLWIPLQPQNQYDPRNVINRTYSTVWTLGGECKGLKVASPFVYTSRMHTCEYDSCTVKCHAHHNSQTGSNSTEN